MSDDPFDVEAYLADLNARDEAAERARIELRRRNRRIAAARVSWPAGALETCERLDGEHPGWFVEWLFANEIRGWERPAGFMAFQGRGTKVFAPTPEELAERIAAAEERIEARRLEERAMWERMREGLR